MVLQVSLSADALPLLGDFRGDVWLMDLEPHSSRPVGPRSCHLASSGLSFSLRQRHQHVTNRANFGNQETLSNSLDILRPMILDSRLQIPT